MLFFAIRLRPMEYASALWRPVAASALMGALISSLIGAQPPPLGVGDAAMQLLVGVPIGILSYALILSALWLISGRPDAIEAQISRWLLKTIRARRDRGEAK
jgi:hypothetical protein